MGKKKKTNLQKKMQKIRARARNLEREKQHASEKYFSAMSRYPYNYKEREAFGDDGIERYLDFLEDKETDFCRVYDYVTDQQRNGASSLSERLRSAKEKRMGKHKQDKSMQFMDFDSMESLAYSISFVLGLWKRTKQAYKVDKTFYSLVTSVQDKEIFPEVFQSLPFRSFYIDLSGLGEKIGNMQAKGVFVSVCHFFDAEKASGGYSFVFAFHTEDSTEFGVDVFSLECIARPGRKTFISDFFNGEEEEYKRKLAANIICLILYIASQNADISSEPTEKEPGEKNPSGKRKERKEESPPVKDSRIGFRIGSAIEKRNSVQYDSIGGRKNGKPKAPHVRRAHWQHYWTGKKDSTDRKIILKFVAESFVNCKDDKDLPVTEHRNSNLLLVGHGS